MGIYRSCFAEDGFRGYLEVLDSCVLINSRYVIIINGSPTKRFHMERGLRQGDFLFSFLFALVAEVLNYLICQVVSNGVINGI